MKAKHFLGMGIVTGAFSVALVGAGCGGSSTTSGTGGTGGTSTTTTTTTTVSVTTGAGGGGSGGMGGGPSTDTSAATATTVMVNGTSVTKGNLGSNTTKDYYTFTAKAGERLLIAANAVSIVTPTPASDETNILDTVITVFDSNMNQLAQDDDAWPRVSSDSSLFFEAPAAGTYYYVIDSCDTAVPNCGEMASGINDYRYETFVADVSMLNHTEFYAGTGQDGTTAKAVPVTFTVTTNEASLVTIDGDTFTAGKPQVFSFTVPATLTPMTGSRLRTQLWVQPAGTTNGDGSTSTITAWVTDMTGTTILAQADQVNYKDGDNQTDGPLDLSVPVTSGSQYYLFVQDDAAAPAATDYYFVVGTLESGNPIQTAQTNISAATAQVLTTTTDQPDDYFVDGNITALAPTQFWYEVDPPSGAKSVGTSCGSARDGSGVQGFTVDLQAQVGASGTPSSIVTSQSPAINNVEMATADLAVPVQTASALLSIPTGTTKMFLVVSGTGQSATVTDTSYECAVYYQ
jgi:Bacterial pre-peptidase C-terminal domain